MTDSPAPDPVQAIFNSLTLERGGVASLSALHVELCATLSRLLAGISTAPADDVPRLAETTSKLMAQLPPPVATDARPFDLRLLSNEQLMQLETIQRTASGEIAPVVEPIIVERERGRAEVMAEQLGLYVDQHAEAWQHRPLTEREQLALRNMFQSVAGSAFVCRNLWNDIYRQTLEDEIRRAVTAALEAAGRSDVSIVKPTPEEAKRAAGGVHDNPGALLSPGIENYAGLFTGGPNSGRFDNRT